MVYFQNIFSNEGIKSLTSSSSLAEKYVHLALAIDQHKAGYIDSYFGAPEWKEQAIAQGKRSLDELVAEAAALATSLVENGHLDPQRKDFLTRQVTAMQTSLRLLKGEKLSLVEETQGLYDITPTWTEETVFDEAQCILNELLTPGGTLQERMALRRKRLEIPTNQARQVVPLIKDHLRNLTRARYPLPVEEDFEVQYVNNQPWGAYNWYLGNCRSRVEINTDLPLHIHSLPGLLAHEAYPGHHTELANKEKSLLQQAGYVENCLTLINTPSCVVSEGLADRALEVVMNDNEQADWNARELFPRAGFAHLDAWHEQAITQALRKLVGVESNAAFLLHEQGATVTEVREYMQRFGLLTEEQAAKLVEFLSHPLYRAYIFTYHYGGELFDQLVAKKGNLSKWFTRLLTEPVTPQQIRLWIADC
jgi:hypothetical protein